MKFNIVYILIVLFLVTSCSSEDSIYEVSMVSLISSPESMLDKLVLVKGYYGSKGIRIYLSKESYENKDYASSIPIYLDETVRKAFSESECRGNYIQVEGRLEEIILGEKSMPVIGLSNIASINLKLGENEVDCLSKSNKHAG